jgi:hypothetical protein
MGIGMIVISCLGSERRVCGILAGWSGPCKGVGSGMPLFQMTGWSGEQSPEGVERYVAAHTVTKVSALWEELQRWQVFAIVDGIAVEEL